MEQANPIIKYNSPSRLWQPLELSKPADQIEIPQSEIEAFQKATDEQICAVLNQRETNPYWFILAQNRDNIRFDNKQGKFVVIEQSVCGCEFGCADWNTYAVVHGISQFENDFRR